MVNPGKLPPLNLDGESYFFDLKAANYAMCANRTSPLTFRLTFKAVSF